VEELLVLEVLAGESREPRLGRVVLVLGLCVVGVEGLGDVIRGREGGRRGRLCRHGDGRARPPGVPGQGPAESLMSLSAGFAPSLGGIRRSFGPGESSG
jgi:hypothetical protein